ncbi:fimbrial biogenesis chaperone [Chitinophaga tropicalis]|uniref:Molecular chaperone n=1 Tax=Chitinophaga tropicalis TaxID=2683588 RepID=A0A7K1TZV0_9BACT|nr:molecular chaperone [Chitinophaga tropicalis]MVT07638.1 molecular chaperone [Chitinophaga tropicalis]
MRIASLLMYNLCIIQGLFVLTCQPATAQGNLLITPRRVVFDGSQRTQELNLANTGQDTARYLISLIEIRMKEDGTFENITQPDSGQRFASGHIRFFPRSVVLGPGEAQMVKVQIEKAGELQPGEYRSHIYFRAAPDEKPLGEEAPKDAVAIAVKLIPLFGISIPVIIQVGASNAKVQVTDLSLSHSNDTISKLSLNLQREGDMSVYGDITVRSISDQGKAMQVGYVKGVAVYTPCRVRQLNIPLSTGKKADYRNGKLQVTYTAMVKGKPVVLSEAELMLH